jgi:5-methyltetrahydrofolate--homocysteine methyltransferase
MTPEQRLHWRIVHRHKEGVEADIDEIINREPSPLEGRGQGEGLTHETAVHTLNTVLLPAMKEVGDKFGAGELILPFVLQSAEVMKKSVAHLENYLEKVEGVSKGLVVIATVYGDVHDIGKNLVKTILANNGYDVIDLGKQVPAETIISKAAEVNATAIGLSALLVSTSKQMPLIVNELQRRGLQDSRCWSVARPSTGALAAASCSPKTVKPTSPASSTAKMPSKAWKRWTN